MLNRQAANPTGDRQELPVWGEGEDDLNAIGNGRVMPENTGRWPCRAGSS